MTKKQQDVLVASQKVMEKFISVDGIYNTIYVEMEDSKITLTFKGHSSLEWQLLERMENITDLYCVSWKVISGESIQIELWK